MSAFTRPHLSQQEGREILYCHRCRLEWYRAVSDSNLPLSCTNCHSDFVEVIEANQAGDDDNDDPRATLPTFEALLTSTFLGNGVQRAHNPLSHARHVHQHEHFHNHARGSAGSSVLQPPLDSFSNLRDRASDRPFPRAHLDPTSDQDFEDDDDDDLEDLLDPDHALGHGHDHDDPMSYDSDPEEADIDNVTENEHNFRTPTGNVYIRRTTTTFLPGVATRSYTSVRTTPRGGPVSASASASTPLRRPGGPVDPSDPLSLLRTISHLIAPSDAAIGRSGADTLFAPERERERNADRSRDVPRRSPVHQVHRINAQIRNGQTSFTIATGPLGTQTAGEAAAAPDFESIFADILAGGNNAEQAQGGPRADGAPAMSATVRAILSLLSANLNGDAVDSDEALDRIVSMLMESNPPAAGAPPATQNAIDGLERKKVDEQLLGPENHAECTICISEVELHEEVLALPCRHWFHEECVVMWLKQHNTCPVCRQAVVGDGSPDAAAAPGQPAATSSATPAAAPANAAANSTSVPVLPVRVPIGLPLSLYGEMRSQNRFAEVIRRRPVIAPASYYRSPRDAERSASARRRRDSHSPVSGPAYASTRGRYNESGLQGLREDASASLGRNRWGASAYSSSSSQPGWPVGAAAGAAAGTGDSESGWNAAERSQDRPPEWPLSSWQPYRGPERPQGRRRSLFTSESRGGSPPRRPVSTVPGGVEGPYEGAGSNFGSSGGGGLDSMSGMAGLPGLASPRSRRRGSLSGSDGQSPSQSQDGHAGGSSGSGGMFSSFFGRLTGTNSGHGNRRS